MPDMTYPEPDDRWPPIIPPMPPAVPPPPPPPVPRQGISKSTIVVVVVLAVAVLGGVIAMVNGLASGKTHAAAAIPSDRIFTDCPFAAGGCPGSHTPPATSAPAVPVPSISLPPPSPTPAWAPCNCDADFLGGDTCDAANYSNQAGDLLDAFIENKDFVNEARLKDCPQFLPTWQRAKTGFSEGVELVGKDVQPGRYETTSYMTGGRVVNCYWERSRNGQIVANNFVSGASKVTITIASGDDAVTTRGCGDWVKVG